MKRKRSISKKSLERAVNDLRFDGFQPLTEKGKLVDWRKIRKGFLITATVTVHDSGRVTIFLRSSEHEGKTRRKWNRRSDSDASSTGTADSAAA